MIKKLEKEEYLVPEELKHLDKDKFFSILNFLPKKEIALLEEIFEDITNVFEKEKINATKTELFLLNALIKKINSIVSQMDFEIPNDLNIYTEKEKNQALAVLLKRINYDDKNDVLKLKNTLYKNRLKNMLSDQYPSLFQLFSFCPMADLFACIGKLNEEEREILKKYTGKDFKGKFILGQYKEELILILLKLYCVIVIDRQKANQISSDENSKLQIEKNKNGKAKHREETNMSKQVRKKRDYLREYFSEYDDEVFLKGIKTLTEYEKETLAICYGKNYDKKFDRKEVDAKTLNHLAYVLRKLSLQMEKFSGKENVEQTENINDTVSNIITDDPKNEKDQVKNEQVSQESTNQVQIKPKLNIDSDNLSDYLKIYTLFQELLYKDTIKMLEPSELMIISLKYEYGPHSNEEIAKFLNLDIKQINDSFNKYLEELRKKSIELVNNALDNFIDLDDNLKNSYIKK